MCVVLIFFKYYLNVMGFPPMKNQTKTFLNWKTKTNNNIPLRWTCGPLYMLSLSVLNNDQVI